MIRKKMQYYEIQSTTKGLKTSITLKCYLKIKIYNYLPDSGILYFHIITKIVHSIYKTL